MTFICRKRISLLLVLLAGAGLGPAYAGQKEKKPAADPYAAYVWPPPPDKPRIKLETVLSGRADLEGKSKLARILIGTSPKSPWDDLLKPYAVEFDPQGRVLVTDTASGGLLRFDVTARKFDVLGTQGAVTLKQPLGLDVAPDGAVYVADGGLNEVLAFGPDGKLAAIFGKPGELTHPTDAALSPDGKTLFVADSGGHRIVTFDATTGEKKQTFGKQGVGPGEFNFPSALTFTPEGQLVVVDQMNARIQILSPDGEYLDGFGQRGEGFGQFVRPKDVAVDEVGIFYVSDFIKGGIDLFDADFTLLTFIGSRGLGPGQFDGASGVAVSRERIAVVDQLGHRLQIFRFVAPKTGE